MARGGLIWQGKGVLGMRAVVLLFFHGLGTSSSTVVLGLLGTFSLEAWLLFSIALVRDLVNFQSDNGKVAAASSNSFTTNNSPLPIFHIP
ncbi:hypothetical protein F8M41_001623 [Gigaspora margarita]|uniref:Uncharacterized protein n=1 Tax=Gigaspora margarita TaxID=4874 RepID=A0A8H4ESM3_GIGMA|nr:hypothetical protein F8M41_001623 [Gigaspora margarita]